ncbi:MAG: hypothetical protein ABIS69_00880 [Sediminibacterium sp.]
MINNTDQQALRRKVLRWSGLGSLVLLAGFNFRKLFSFSKKTEIIACAPEQKTIKMLTQDGRLVEINASTMISAERKKISDDQLKAWVSRKES